MAWHAASPFDFRASRRGTGTPLWLTKQLRRTSLLHRPLDLHTRGSTSQLPLRITITITPTKMLDENLPAFFLRSSPNGPPHHRALFLSHRGSDPELAYAIHHVDPASPDPLHKNCYVAALFDAFTQDVLYGEVVARPDWIQSTPLPDDIRRSIAPPTQPNFPSTFTVQLYNPDLQVKVTRREGKWGASDSYEFSLPQDVFRLPSESSLDRGQSDPASLSTTPQVQFVWRKESKLSKDLTCFMTGKSTDTKAKKSKRDPDIIIALWRQMREMTIYESNLARVELEDPKGLEVVLLLGAIVIKDLYFSSREQINDIFHISSSARKLSGGGRKLSSPQAPVFVPPAPDSRGDRTLEAETVRLKAEADAEARAARHRQREREKADEAERRRLQKMVEEEEKAERSRQAEVDRETERLRKLYGVQPLPAQTASHASHARAPRPRHGSQPPRPGLGVGGVYGGAGTSASASTLQIPSHLNGGGNGGAHAHRKKHSFFRLRHSSEGEDGHRNLARKKSANW